MITSAPFPAPLVVRSARPGVVRSSARDGLALAGRRAVAALAIVATAATFGALAVTGDPAGAVGSPASTPTSPFASVEYLAQR